jgi:GR25 family glycosyltransferase involved in LPS biosynthesis
MKIKVITLPTAEQRQKRIKESFAANSLEFEFAKGINFGDCIFSYENENYYVIYGGCTFLINEELFVKNTNRHWMRFGEIAAYLAHYFVWKDFKASDEDKIIICEDDANPQSNMSFLNDIDYTDIEFVNLQTVTAHNQQKQQMYREPFVSFTNNGLVKYENYFPVLCEGLAAYMLTKKGAETLCSFIEKYGFVGPNDCLIAKLGEQKLMPIHSPVELDKCFGLDPETNQYSYTHSGTFKDYKTFNNTVLQIRV